MLQLGPPPLSVLVSLLLAKMSFFATVAPHEAELQANTFALGLLIGAFLALEYWTRAVIGSLMRTHRSLARVAPTAILVLLYFTLSK